LFSFLTQSASTALECGIVYRNGLGAESADRVSR
jgi:hypothetical protein